MPLLRSSIGLGRVSTTNISLLAELVLLGAADLFSLSRPTLNRETILELRKGYFNFERVSWTFPKLGRSFGVGVCSLYWMTPFLSMTKAARAAVSPTPASIGNTTSYFLVTSLLRSLARGMVIFSFCAQACCANGVSTLMPITSALRFV